MQVAKLLKKHGVVVDEAAARKKARNAAERAALVGLACTQLQLGLGPRPAPVSA